MLTKASVCIDIIFPNGWFLVIGVPFASYLPNMSHTAIITKMNLLTFINRHNECGAFCCCWSEYKPLNKHSSCWWFEALWRLWDVSVMGMFFLQVYIHTRQGANCVFIRNTDRLGIYTQKSPGAVAHVFDTVNAATTLKHTELNLAATPRPGDTIRFDSLAFPYRFSAAAYIDTGGGISCENTVISLNISMVGLCFALLWYVFMRLSVISGCREIIYQGLFCV